MAIHCTVYSISLLASFELAYSYSRYIRLHPQQTDIVRSGLSMYSSTVYSIPSGGATRWEGRRWGGGGCIEKLFVFLKPYQCGASGSKSYMAGTVFLGSWVNQNSLAATFLFSSEPNPLAGTFCPRILSRIQILWQGLQYFPRILSRFQILCRNLFPRILSQIQILRPELFSLDPEPDLNTLAGSFFLGS